MIESMRAVEVLTLAALTNQHRQALLLGGEIATRWRIVTNDEVRLRSEDELALLQAADAESMTRHALLNYEPRDAAEAMEKAMYISAVMIAQGRVIDVEEMERLIGSLGY